MVSGRTTPTRTVLCFGDSNTWGHLPPDGVRIGRWKRWPGVLQLELGDDVYVIEEGLRGRTTVFEDPFTPGRNGLAALPMLLETHAPLDAVVILLGTNDLFLPEHPNAYQAAVGVGAMVELVRARAGGQGEAPPAILVVAPPPLGPIGPWEAVSPSARQASAAFGEAFRWITGELGVSLVDLGEHIASSPVDGIHFEVVDHAVVGRVVTDALRPMLGL
ncbi:MAG TPA: GDSL-type esterase/lipase family protein [Actinomycetota bacterium]|nr:GDSL-type esterase/lipase family protein [Actinomycetota bacterium]